MSNKGNNIQYSFIQSHVDFSSENIYNLVDSYFDHPIMEKFKNEQGLSIYMCKIKTLLASSEQRYLIAICQQDSREIGYKLSLSNIQWKNFQSRTLNEQNVKTKHSYLSKNTESFQIPVTLKKRYEDHTDYTTEGIFKCSITLLHKNKNLYSYPENGTIAACLETFQTIITI